MSSIKFVTEDSIEEARQARQEEWKKAYENKENPPPIPDEVPYDPRTLYERLQEQKQKKDDAFAEATKFGNLIHRIDNDEFDFLSTLESDEAKKKKELEEQEQEELKKFRQNVQLKAVTVPAQPSDLLTAVAPKSNPPSFDVTAVPRKKKSLFAGLVKKDESKTSSSAGSSNIKGQESKVGGKRKAEDDAKIEKADTTDNKKAKVETTTTSAPSKPNALLALAAYDSSSDEDA
ncbi:hypothetical protein EMPS_01250 [Entomortierella parvispora]|uniref:FAM192A/Fyv6 N-terminal domain-containing protein n=1 Tax=Entomortierella parvispora TaxID=205924 RepID=A0A9P3LSI1_9FUNG|nr:hypothetical protein EMPS_01250 [Entomortierella parvispora]